MWPYLAAGAVAAGALAYKLLHKPAAVKPKPAPGPFKPVVYNKPVPAPSHGTSTAHTVPGGHFVYTGAQAPQAEVQAAADALAAVDPTLKQNEQLVRNFQDAAGLAQRPGGPGWDQVQPTGTDGRYGHDVRAVLGQYVSNPPPASATRPSWWGNVGAYTNR